jgi:hypothetical protein
MVVLPVNLSCKLFYLSKGQRHHCMAGRTTDQLLDLPEIKPSKKLPQLSRLAETDPAIMTLPDALAEAHTLREAEKRAKAVKARILELMQARDMAGVRCGTICAITRFQAGRKTFDPARAIDAGVTPEQIVASMKQGADYWVIELPEIKDED